MAGKLKWSAYGMVVLGTLPVLCVYLISVKLTKQHFLSFLIAALLALDFQVVNFQSIILSDCFSTVVFMVFVWASMVRSESLGFVRFCAVVFLEMLLIFSRAIFFMLPILMYFTHLAFLFISHAQTEFDRKRLYYCLTGLICNVAAVSSLCYYNYLQIGEFVYSRVPEYGIVGKWSQFGFLDRTYRDPPRVLVELIEAHQRGAGQHPDRSGALMKSAWGHEPWNEKTWNEKTKTVRHYFWRHDGIAYFGRYVFATLKLMPEVFTEKREFYSYPGWLKNEKWFLWLNFLFDRMNVLKFLAAVSCLLVVLNHLFRKNFSEARGLICILLPCFYMIAAVSAFAYNEYVRLRAPVELLLDLMVLLPVIWAAQAFQNFGRRPALRGLDLSDKGGLV